MRVAPVVMTCTHASKLANRVGIFDQAFIGVVEARILDKFAIYVVANLSTLAHHHAYTSNVLSFLFHETTV
jgi:hypothetical protein